MKRKRTKKTKITDLNVDVLKLIMISVAKSSDGAGSFARAISVCKAFTELAEDKELLKAVAFVKGSVSGYDDSFWKINGLLSKCASARNMAACNILLTYLEERIQSSEAKVTATELAMKDFAERAEAVRAVFTRARMRAAMLAAKKVRCMIDDVRMDVDEIREHVKRFRAASTA
ncbi:uncharacterized protein LOC130753310 isoform X1 [Actinidia eriantha]|uniref:uncharacterized protein LOC130753310 isoform X1 n=1 Tax=Actinidia eriantha TaxID=165200 RepID=UPI0025879ED8|nr:uncharacterized protein LOC130753310 isoform X1 [Actinidia eriantha]